MALQKITFDGCSVTSKRDADLNYHISGCVPAGIISGLGNECSVSVSNNYITFQDGYVEIYGRRIYVEAGSQVYVSLDSTKYGYVVIEVNLSSNTATLKSIETTSSSYPSLTQQDLSRTGTLYQFPITKYKKTSSSITLQTFTPNYITPGLREVTPPKLVRKFQYRYFEDSNYETIEEVSFPLDGIPSEAMLFLTFSVVDTMGYGGFNQHMGTITIPLMDAYWDSSYHLLRSSQNSGKSGTFMIYLDGTDYSNLKIKRVDSVYGPNCVELSYYVLE